ncbi:head decoration protein [Methanothermococcus okinawensis]|uniref:Head decoration protein n=1 Tax=Methanothermococcus okinawensis (strain DSM 14208 / JCM 11175 / IH1) TaxID=647113 RepID=F8ANU6_METOI|nr:head decoration protein [Methanothermococcus okinawensis]AEH06300.1 hypothetical protein Metok_0310 [Methanothermococcus okinawensis IH1]
MKINYAPLYTTEGLITLKGNAAPGEAISAGTVIGIISASGELSPYNSSATDGTEVARGIALCDIDAADEDRDIIYAIAGAVIESKCIGLDATAKEDLSTIYFVKDSQL